MTNLGAYRQTVFTFLLLFGFVTPEPAVGDTLSIVYSGNFNGELEPCGCTEGANFGGIKRRATLVDQLREQDPDLIVLSAGGLVSHGAAGDRRRGKYILKGFSALNYDAIAVQWPDLAYGTEFTTAEKLPWVASNWLDQTFTRQLEIKRADRTLTFFSWLDPESSPLRKMKGGNPRIDQDVQALQQSLAMADRRDSLTVLATTLPLASLQQLIALNVIDILLIKANHEVYGEPFLHGKTLVLQPGTRGMRVGKLQLQLNQQGDIEQWRHEVIPLSASIADAPRLAAWYEAYNAETKEAYQKKAALRKLRMSGTSPYVGAKECETCHPSEYAAWQTSQHRLTFKNLQSIGKDFDPACLVCHTVGFDRSGGFVDRYITSHLTGVQCESCHGTGRGHINTEGKQRTAHADWPPEKICRQCHNRSHSPSFDMKQYWPKIAH